MMNRRYGLMAGMLVALVMIWSVRLLPGSSEYTAKAWETAKSHVSGLSGGSAKGSGSGKALAESNRARVEVYYQQAFSAGPPATEYAFAELTEACARADWGGTGEEGDEDKDTYMSCGGMSAGMTSIISQVKVCLKMAVETGSHLLLPRMPLRDSHDLLDFNFLNEAAYMPYDKWFDADHLRQQLARACPRMRVLHPDEVDAGRVAVRRRFNINCGDAVGYQQFHSYFWVGRPYRTFFQEQFQRRVAELEAKGLTADKGITIVDVDSQFMAFRLTDDPTHGDVRLWTDLAHLVRFRDAPRQLVHRLAQRLPADLDYYGVHFRAENDSIWSTPEHQMHVDLDALDKAWERFGGGNASDSDGSARRRPLLYLACGDAQQVEKFSGVALARGWEVTHKWRLAAAADNEDSGSGGNVGATTAAINALAFDFQGAVDMGILVRSRFFIGLQGSAFSSTIANLRDPAGRYRGSSLDLPQDDGAHNHLFNDLDATEYACCL